MYFGNRQFQIKIKQNNTINTDVRLQIYTAGQQTL